MFTPMPDDARHRVLYRNIGQFLANWTQAEWSLAMLLAALLKTDLERARMLLAINAGFRSKRELILRLGRSYLPDEHLKPFEETMAQVKHLSEKRNLLAHRRAFYHERGTFRFFSDEDPTQPNVFGRYQDIQTATIKVWTKETADLTQAILRLWRVALKGPLLMPARLIPEPDEGLDP